MDEKHLHQLPEEDLFFKQAKVPYARSKEQVWEELLPELENRRPAAGARKIRRKPRLKWVAAASIALLLGLGSFFRFYTSTVECAPGMRLSHQLPDGSTVDLNSDSRLSYHPYWWAIDRSLSFEGEGFFTVEKGSAFRVKSRLGTTQVMGTSFNISTRYERYAVFCRTGMVKVIENRTEDFRVLEPGTMVEIAGEFRSPGTAEEKEILAWLDNRLHFDAAPLPEALEEIGRQYGVEINLQVKNPSSIKYSAYLKRPDSAVTVLNLICDTYSLTLSQLNERSFTIVE